MEPYRPIVDLYVAEEPVRTEECDLLPSDKLGLIGLLNLDVLMPRGTMSVLASIEQAAESLMRVYEKGSSAELELPRLIWLRQHAVDA